MTPFKVIAMGLEVTAPARKDGDGRFNAVATSFKAEAPAFEGWSPKLMESSILRARDGR